MKNIINRLFVGLGLAVVLAACADVINPKPPKQNETRNARMGTVKLSVAGTGERVILPGKPLFTRYEFTFEPLDGQTGHNKVTVDSGGSAAVELTQGKWNIIAKGFVNISGIAGIADGYYRAAEGRADNVAISAGQTSSVSIDLKGGVQAGEKGILSWDIHFPQDTASAAMVIRTLEGTAIKTIYLKAQARGDTVLDSGYYLVTLYGDNQQSKTEILHIYGSLTSRVERYLYNNAFYFDTVSDLADWLGNAPANTANTPYDIVLYGLDIETDFTHAQDFGYYSTYDSLRLLYNSLQGKYVNLDLSLCTGQAIGNTFQRTAIDRPDIDKIVGIKLPEGLKTIGNSAFGGCSSLTSVTIPDSVTSIGDDAFGGCTGLTSITIPDSVTSIGDSAFYNCSGLTSVTIPDSVTSIGNYAFAGASQWNPMKLTSVIIGNSVTSIGDGAFSYCSGLTEINVSPLNTNYTYVRFFYGNTGGILYRKNPYSINQAFGSIPNKIIIPDGVTSIGNSAFSGYSELTSVTIPNSVTSIGDYAFSGCSELTSITIPDSVTSIGYQAFNGCSGLRVYITDLSAWCKINFDYTQYFSFYIYINGVSATDITIPDSVTTIGDRVFRNIENIISVTIPDSVISIGNSAFYGCSGLTSITIPDSVTSIGSSAFSGCSELTSITIGNSVTSIGNSAFSGCSELTAINVSPLNANYTSVNGILYRKNPYSIIAVPGKISGAITIPYGVTSIGDAAFSGCSGLTSVTIPNSVTSIGKDAFSGCTSLTGITIPNSVTWMDSAFSGCTSLTSVIIPDSVTYSNSRAFSFCTSLTSVTIGNSLVYISPYTFYYCRGLTSVIIGDSVTSIGTHAFENCSSLTSVTIPDRVTSIEDWAFSGTGLTSVTIPDRVTSIGKYAFPGISSVTFQGTITASGFDTDGFYDGGDLRDKYLAGGVGTYTYTNASGSYEWTKQ
jgi:hypothetical protein